MTLTNVLMIGMSGGGGGGGGTAGPATSTDNALARWNGAGGNKLKDSTALLTATNLYPSANDGLALGLSGTAFADLFLASGALIDWNAGDVTITHSANTLAFSGASSGYTYDSVIKFTASANFPNATPAIGLRSASGGLMTIDSGGAGNPIDFSFGNSPLYKLEFNTFHPSNNDGSALGKAGTAWSDLFLADGALIDWANGVATLTFSSGLNYFEFNREVHFGQGANFEDGDINSVGQFAVNTVIVGNAINFKKTSIASANDLDIASISGQIYAVTGATQINRLNAPIGNIIYLYFDSNITLKNNQAAGGGFYPMLLSGGADFAATANDTIAFLFTGTDAISPKFIELSRSSN